MTKLITELDCSGYQTKTWLALSTIKKIKVSNFYCIFGIVSSKKKMSFFIT